MMVNSSVHGTAEGSGATVQDGLQGRESSIRTEQAFDLNLQGGNFEYPNK